MKSYTYSGPDARVLPDLPATVGKGDTIDVPDDFFASEEQATEMGFTPAKAKSKVKPLDNADTDDAAPAPVADAPSPAPDPTPAAAPAADAAPAATPTPAK